MKIVSYIVMALGVAMLVFAIVCMSAAGKIIDTAEDPFYTFYQQMGLDHVELLELAGMPVGAFDEFAYHARFWLLGGAIGLIIVGGALLAVGIMKGKKRAGGANYVSMPSMMVCPSCGSPVAANSAFCMNCGSPVAAKPASIKPVSVDRAPAKAHCPSCGAENDAGNKFCMSCGAALNSAPTATSAAPAASAAVSAYGSRTGTGTISATPVTGDAGTVRLDTRGTSSGTVRIDTRVAAPAKSEPAYEAPRPAEPVHEDATASTGTVMLSVKKESKPAPMKGRLSKAGDL